RAYPQVTPPPQAGALGQFERDLASALAKRPSTLAAARAALQGLAANAAQIPELDRQCRQLLAELDLLAPAAVAQDNAIPTLRELAAQGAAPASERMAQLAQLVVQAGDMARMDYDFLYDEVRRLLAIGYHVSERKRDAGYYDLLASEA